jgi:hypothetical protein
MPEQGATADLLIFALIAPGAADPIEGMIHAAQIELAALANAAPTRAIAEAINFVGRRLR